MSTGNTICSVAVLLLETHFALAVWLLRKPIFLLDVLVKAVCAGT